MSNGSAKSFSSVASSGQSSSGSPSGSGGGCSCLSNPDFQYGYNAYTINRYWRTVVTQSGDFYTTGDDYTDTWDWSDSYASGPSSGYIEFTTCNVQGIELEITSQSGAGDALVDVYINGWLQWSQPVTGGDILSGLLIDIFNSPDAVPCENVIRIAVSYDSGFADGVVTVVDVD